MDRFDAISWFEQWADKHGIALAPMRRCRPGESYIGWVRQPADGEVLSIEALNEALAMGKQLVFEEMGPELPPPAPASGSATAAGGGLEDSPLTNRGDKVTIEPFKGFQITEGLCAAVDQFTLVGKGEASREALTETLREYLGDGQAGLYGHNTYKESWRFECGASIEFTPGREDWCLRVTGQTLGLVGEKKHIAFLIDCDKHTDHCTRVDPRLDDYSRKLIDLGEVSSALDAGNFAGPRSCQVIRKHRNLHGKLKTEGATYAFGSRDSTRVIFYDKGLESKGRICSNRCEAGQYKEKAAVAWVKLIEAARRGQDDFTRAVGEIVCGSIDFVERGEHRHLARMTRLPFWASVVNQLGRVKLKVEKTLSTLNSSMASMIRQYGKKLGRAIEVADAMGEDLILQLVHKCDQLREGQTVVEKWISPLERQFSPRQAFVLT